MSGIQKKLLVVEDGDGFAPASPTGPAPFIAKFNSPGIATLVRNEMLSLRWCRAVLGRAEVNEAGLGVVGREAALIVTRFDRSARGDKLRLEDFAQILCKPRGRDYAGKYDAAYEDAAAIIQARSARPLIDLARFFQRVVLFALIGNCDGHLKNFSLLETEDGLRLSPLYDELNTALYPGYDQQLALSIAGRKRHLDDIGRTLLEQFGLSIGLSQRAVTATFKTFASRVESAMKLLQPPQGEPPEGFGHRFREIVSNACLRILT